LWLFEVELAMDSWRNQNFRRPQSRRRGSYLDPTVSVLHDIPLLDTAFQFIVRLCIFSDQIIRHPLLPRPLVQVVRHPAVNRATPLFFDRHQIYSSMCNQTLILIPSWCFFIGVPSIFDNKNYYNKSCRLLGVPS
jgi:hypothetical protein